MANESQIVPTQNQPDNGIEATTTINLQHAITVNGRRYPAGQGVKVPKAQADDIARMDYEASEQDKNLHIKRTNMVDAGTIAAGGE